MKDCEKWKFEQKVKERKNRRTNECIVSFYNAKRMK